MKDWEWLPEKFDEEIINAANKKMINGQYIEGKMQIYDYIAENLPTKRTIGAVQRWRECGNTGPGTFKEVKALEKIFNTIFHRELTEDEIEKNAKKNEQKQYSNYVKSKVEELYNLIKTYLSSDYVPNSDVYEDTLGRIYGYRISIPEDCFENTVRFFMDYIDPIVRKENQMKKSYERLLYQAVRLDKLERKECQSIYLNKQYELVANFEMFAKNTYHPIIMS